MSPRPPPKISLGHEWTKDLGSKVVQKPEGETVRQPEGEVVRQTKFFQSTQLIPNTIRDRSGRPDEMQDERKTSHSQEISVNSFNEEPSSSDRTRRPVNDTVAVQDDPQEHHEAGTLNIDDETLRERIEADMDFRIPGLPHSIVKHAQSTSVRELIQKIENHPNRHALQQDLRQNQSFNPFSPESKQMIRDVGNIELCELLETESKTQCKVCLSYWDIGIVYCTCGHFLRKGRGRIRNSSSFRWTFFQFPSTSSRKDNLTDIGKKPGDREYYIANQLKKKCKKKFFQGIHERFTRDETFRNRMIENGRDEDACRQMNVLADEDHTHHLTPQEYFHYKSNWWLRSNETCSNTVPVERRPDFEQALSTLQQLKQKEEGAQRNQQWAQSFSSSSSWWSWQGSWWTPYSYESHHGDEPSTDRTG